jgi:L-lactate dehydrogenase complex protein LldG
MTSSRERILERARLALTDGGTGEPASVARAYRRAGTLAGAQLLTRFIERVEDYHARVRGVGRAGLPGAVADALRSHGVRRLAISSDLAEEWLKALDPSLEVLRDGHPVRLSTEQLSSVDGVLSACALAIAETGTLVLDGGAGQGRRALTLLPDHHLCVVEAGQVVETVPEAVAALAAAVAGHRAPLTFVSGPSATSDIELTRVEGVHGPRTLEVILVEGA